MTEACTLATNVDCTFSPLCISCYLACGLLHSRILPHPMASVPSGNDDIVVSAVDTTGSALLLLYTFQPSG